MIALDGVTLIIALLITNLLSPLPLQVTMSHLPLNVQGCGLGLRKSIERHWARQGHKTVVWFGPYELYVNGGHIYEYEVLWASDVILGYIQAP